MATKVPIGNVGFKNIRQKGSLLCGQDKAIGGIALQR